LPLATNLFIGHREIASSRRLVLPTDNYSSVSTLSLIPKENALTITDLLVLSLLNCALIVLWASTHKFLLGEIDS
jgi:hypothetical protein